MSAQTVLITGTSTGFGRLAAEHVARNGHKVFATMRGVDGKNAEPAAAVRSLADAEKLDLQVLELDVTKQADIDAAVSRIADAGGLDVLVNNAGIFGMGPTEGYTEDQFRQILETNVIGVHALTRSFLPQLRERDTSLVINISSGAGRLTMPGAAIYTASKFALEALTEGYRYDTSEHGVDFVCIEPGAYGTDIFGKSIGPANEAILEAYPQFMQTVAAVGEGLNEAMQAEGANDPNEIGHTILDLINQTPGERPLRVPVGKDMVEVISALNRQSAEYQRSFLEAFGFGGYAKYAE